ncbi:phage portal protein [Allostreptomyces psammosilenae]|uniref:Portal protein n=1 Tax=Allostreptomyces psammosilenae TaxID=1892865 RepID=A0A852ZVU1_9ACTN|nr:phage portal protein [Allostreptomyces psammosilenae]NYI06065.1 hypothetical protein [Allostreptomyces psammosilenae]
MAESPMDTLGRLYSKLKRRHQLTRVWSDYYDGKQPLKFTSPEFATQTGGIFDGFADNWCQVIPDVTVERLMPMAFRLEDGTLDKAAWRSWRRNECDVEISLALLEALITGRSYALVWKPDGVQTEITFHDASRAVVEYVPGKRRVRAAGLVIWVENDRERATLFLPDRVYWFSRDIGRAGMPAHPSDWTFVSSGAAWMLEREMSNPLRSVPLVALENRSRLNGKPKSEIASVVPLQDAMNALWAHLLTGSDEIALPARAVLGMLRPTREILDANGEVVGEEDLPIGKFRSNRLLWLESPDARIAEFSAADLTNYTAVIEVVVRHVAAQTRTPPSYLTGQMVNISADALIASEAGLVSKVEEGQRFFGAGIREVMRLDALADGDTGRAEALALGSVVWRDAQFRSEAQYADALTKYKAIGVPDEALWERIPGVQPDEIERWLRMRDDQAAAIVGGNVAGLFGPAPVEAPDPDTD